MNFHSPRGFMVITIAFGCVLVSQAEPEDGLNDLQRIQNEDRSCFEKFDGILYTLWNEELNEVKIDGLESIPTIFSFDKPTNPMYNTRFQEWLLKADNLTEKLRQCSTGLYESVLNRFDNDTRICAQKMLKRLIENEEKFSRIAEEDFNRVDLPFRKFLSFNEFNLVVFQNRSIDNLTEVETNTYRDMENYVSNEEDKDKIVWNLRQSCDWEDLRSIKEAKDEEELWNSVKIIVVKSHDRALTHDLITNVDLATVINRERIVAWLNSTTEMETAIDILRPVGNDPRSLCEYASDLGRRFASEQSAILLDRKDRLDFLELRGLHAVGEATSMRDYLKKVGDHRSNHFETLGDRLAEDFNCWWSVMVLLLNQQRFEIATSFVSSEMSFPDVSCSSGPAYSGYLTPQYCECNGSFCQKHLIAHLYVEKYELEKNEISGSYEIVHE